MDEKPTNDLPESDAAKSDGAEGAVAAGTWITNADGTRVPVPADTVQGLKEFREAWGQNVEHPEALSFEAWQQAD